MTGIAPLLDQDEGRRRLLNRIRQTHDQPGVARDDRRIRSPAAAVWPPAGSRSR